MDDQIGKEILEEIRKHNQYMKRMNLYGAIVAIIVVVVIFVAGHYFPKIKYQNESYKKTQTWNEVNSSMDKCEYEKALVIAKTLTENNPKYWYGYTYLGNIYTALGDPKNAEINYSKAYELFPTKENKENLEAIKKVLNKP